MRATDNAASWMRQKFGKMPKLRHYPDPSVPFIAENSEVVQWLLAQPGVGEFLFKLARDAKAIVYDPTAQEWKGHQGSIPVSQRSSPVSSPALRERFADEVFLLPLRSGPKTRKSWMSCVTRSRDGGETPSPATFKRRVGQLQHRVRKLADGRYELKTENHWEAL